MRVNLVNIDLSPEADVTLWNVTPASIANGLACVPRYNGATARPYSVAEHSVLMARWILDRPSSVKLPGKKDTLAVEALVHDAKEALIGDLTWPVLKLLDPEYVKRRTGHIEPKVRKLLGLSGFAVDRAEKFVHEIDLQIVADECGSKELFPESWAQTCFPWNSLGVQICGWDSDRAAREWLDLWHDLREKRAERSVVPRRKKFSRQLDLPTPPGTP